MVSEKECSNCSNPEVTFQSHFAKRIYLCSRCNFSLIQITEIEHEQCHQCGTEIDMRHLYYHDGYCEDCHYNISKLEVKLIEQ